MQSLVLAAILLTSYVAPNPPLSRHDIAIAGDAHHALVVWQEIDFPRTSTLAMRVSPTGVLLDRAPSHIGDYANAFLPRVVWSSGQYRVTAGEIITSVNSAGVAALIPTNVSADNAVDL